MTQKDLPLESNRGFALTPATEILARLNHIEALLTHLLLSDLKRQGANKKTVQSIAENLDSIWHDEYSELEKMNQADPGSVPDSAFAVARFTRSMIGNTFLILGEQV